MAIVITVVLLIMQTFTIYANDGQEIDIASQNEWYELIEEDFETDVIGSTDVTPYTAYLVNVATSIAKISSTKVGMRADVYCSSTVKTITIVFSLQKLSGSTWKTVGTSTVSASNVNSTHKSVTASNVAAGTYRAKASVMVTDNYGYSETLNGYSGSINLP